MKPSAKVERLLQIGLGLVLVGVFAKPLHIPFDLVMILDLAGISLLIWALVAVIKAKAAGKIPITSPSQKQKKFWILVAAYGVACIIAPFLLPFTGVSLPFDELLVLSVITFFICTGITYLTVKAQK